MDWERVNVWTTTLYALIHSMRIARAVEFGNMPNLPQSILEAGTWVKPEASYTSVLASEPFGKSAVKFRRNPNIHFEEVARQVIHMLAQDLVVIFDQMMDDILAARNDTAGPFPQSKVEKLAKHLDPQFEWAKYGCLELIAARNVITHARGRWNKKSITIVSFLNPRPNVGDELIIGFPMLFRYRKAMRTFLNEAMP